MLYNLLYNIEGWLSALRVKIILRQLRHIIKKHNMHKDISVVFNSKEEEFNINGKIYDIKKYRIMARELFLLIGNNYPYMYITRGDQSG